MGEFGDHVGPSLMNSAEEAAAAVQAALYPDGRPLRFVNMRHTWENCTDPLNFCEVEFARRKHRGRASRWLDRKLNERSKRWLFTITVVDPEGANRHVLPPQPHVDNAWVFSGSTWLSDCDLAWPEPERSATQRVDFYAELIRPAHVQVPELLDDQVIEVWPKDLYTPALVGGPDAGKIADQRRLACDRHYAAESGVIDALTNPPPDSFLEQGGSRTPDV
jgi:hypothetical protein